MNPLHHKSLVSCLTGGLLGLTSAIASVSHAATPINSNFFCINPWMPYVTPYWGTFNDGSAKSDQMYQLLKDAGFSSYRIGGNGPLDYNRLVGSSTTGNLDPNVESLVSNIVIKGNGKVQYQIPMELTAAEVTALVNKVLAIPGIPDVNYWLIGNEMELNHYEAVAKSLTKTGRKWTRQELEAFSKDGTLPAGVTTASAYPLNGAWTKTQFNAWLASEPTGAGHEDPNEWWLRNKQGNPYHPTENTPSYMQSTLKTVALAIRAIQPNATIQVFDYAWWDAANMAQYIGGAYDITGPIPAGSFPGQVAGTNYYYADYIGYHNYGLEDTVRLEQDVASFNGMPKNNPNLKLAMGEFNIQHHNDQAPTEDDKVWNFKAGQWALEYYKIGMREQFGNMCLWAVNESNGNRTSATDLGLFDDLGTGVEGRAIYEHLKMAASNKKANWVNSTDGQANVETLAMADGTGVTLIVMNKSKTTGYTMSINLNSTAAATGSAINVDGGLTKTDSLTMGIFETVTLVYDATGTLVKKVTYSNATHYGSGGSGTTHVGEQTAPTVQTFPGGGGGTPVQKMTNFDFATDITGWTTSGTNGVYAYSNLTDANGAVGILKADMTALLANRYDARVYQDKNLVAGKTYKLSVSIRHVGTGSVSPAIVVEQNATPYAKLCDISLDSNGANDIGLTSAANPGPITNTTWRTFTCQFVAPASYQARIEVMLGLVNQGIRIGTFSFTEE